MRQKLGFIVFEGIDGAGKSCQLTLLKEYLQDMGYEVLCTREPGGTKIGESIRDILLDTKNTGMSDICELMLYGASRSEHISRLIAPALNDNKFVLCDRFGLSTLAYQGYGRGIDLDKIRNLNDLAMGEYKPDLTFVFDISPEEASRRMAYRQGEAKDRIEQEKASFFNRVREGYLAEAKRDSSVVVINGAQGQEAVFGDMLKEFEARL